MKSDFQKSYKSPVGAAINQFQSAGCWDKNSGIAFCVCITLSNC